MHPVQGRRRHQVRGHDISKGTVHPLPIEVTPQRILKFLVQRQLVMAVVKPGAAHGGSTPVAKFVYMGLTRVKFGKQQNCDNIRSMTINGVTVTGVDCTVIGTWITACKI